MQRNKDKKKQTQLPGTPVYSSLAYAVKNNKCSTTPENKNQQNPTNQSIDRSKNNHLQK